MNWLLFISGVLGGGIVAALLGELFRQRIAYRTALLLVRVELSRNLVWLQTSKRPEAEPHRDRMFAPGWFVTTAWHAQLPALARRMESKNHALFGELAATYTLLEATAQFGEEPPDDWISDLDSLRDRLGRFDPPMRIRVLGPLLRRKRLRPVGYAVARLFWDENAVREVVDEAAARAAHGQVEE